VLICIVFSKKKSKVIFYIDQVIQIYLIFLILFQQKMFTNVWLILFEFNFWFWQHSPEYWFHLITLLKNTSPCVVLKDIAGTTHYERDVKVTLVSQYFLWKMLSYLTNHGVRTAPPRVNSSSPVRTGKF
jgi:hypothetical protein